MLLGCTNEPLGWFFEEKIRLALDFGCVRRLFRGSNTATVLQVPPLMARLNSETKKSMFFL